MGNITYISKKSDENCSLLWKYFTVHKIFQEIAFLIITVLNPTQVDELNKLRRLR